jgi:hypothetical protein
MAMASPAFRWFALGTLALVASCGDEGRFGPPESYGFWRPVAAGQPELPEVHALPETDVQPLVKLFFEGFAAEMLRTVYMAKQLVREARPGGHPLPGAALAAAVEGLPVVVGIDKDPYGRGLSVDRTLRGPLARPDAIWLGLRAEPEGDKALVQTVCGRLARYTLDLVLSGGTFTDTAAVLPGPLADGYRMAMEVIAREWRVGRGPLGVLAPDAGTAAQRALFADVRENRFVLDEGQRVRPAAEMLASPGVAATVLYRLVQSKAVGQHVAPAEFYAPFAARVPPGVSPASVLGPVRNFQAKLLLPWVTAAVSGHPPRDIADLLQVYVSAFPAEKQEAVRIFIVTTYGATIAAGSVPPPGKDVNRTMAAIDALVAEVMAGRRSLRAAAGP